MTYYGFKVATREGKPAWFHTRRAAERFKWACGGHLGEIDTSNDVDAKDVLDTKERPWGTMHGEPRLDMAGDAMPEMK